MHADNPCPTLNELSDYSVGSLDWQRCEAIDSHLDACPECQQALETVVEPGDTLVTCLHGPAPEDEYAAESACRRVLDLVADVGLEPQLAEQPEAVVAGDEPLGELREYRLLSKLGQGGMGSVYKALHSKLDKVVALKVLPSDRMQDRHMVARFEREMKAVGKLDHPNIVRATDAGEIDDTHFLVMEYVDGVDLSNLAHNFGPLPVADACELMRQAAVGLQHAYEHGLVHRDIKPSNLMLSRTGDVKVLDLGLAILDSDRADGSEITSTGQIMGTVDYMAPEQATDVRHVDIRADIYSLGCTLFRLLTGNAPFSGEGYETNYQKIKGHVEDTPPSLVDVRPDAPPELADVVLRLMAKDPARRFGTPTDVAQTLEPFCQGHTTNALLTVDDQTITTTDWRREKPDSTIAPISSALSDTIIHPATPANSEVSAAQPVPSTTPSSRPRSRKLIATILAVLLLGGAYYAAAPLFKVKTDGGTLVFEGDPAVLKDVTVTVDGKEVDLEIDGKIFTVGVEKTSGEVRVVSADETELLAKRFTFKVGQRRLPFSVSLEPTTTVEPTLSADRRAAEWALSVGGSIGALGRKFHPQDELPGGPFKISEIILNSDHRIDDDELVNLRGLTDVTRLDFVRIRSIDGSGFANLADSGKLTSLAFAFTRVTDDAIRLLPQSPLLGIDLTGTPTTDEAIIELQRFTTLERITLGADMTNAGLKQLSQFPALKSLHCGVKADISDAGMTDIARIRTLNGLSIAGYDNITDDGLKRLESLSSLTGLFAKGTSVTEAGVTALSKALPNCRIEWDGGVIEPTSGNDRAVAEWLREIGARSIGLVNREGQSLSFEDDLPDEEFHIVGIGLNTNERFTDDDLLKLRGLTHLEGLNLSATGLTDKGLTHLQDLPNLWALQLHETQVSDAGMKSIARISNLQYITLNHRITDQALEQLSGISTLRVLSLAGSQVTDGGMAEIGKLSELTHLTLTKTNIGDDGLTHLRPLRKLRQLTLLQTKVTEAGVTALTRALPLCRISWDGGVIEPPSDPDRRAAAWVRSHGGTVTTSLGTFAPAQDLPSEPFAVRSVELSYTDRRVTDDELQNLVGLRELTRVSLVHHTQITDVGVSRLATNVNLTQLQFGGQALTDDSLAEIAKLTKLQLLDLTGTNMTDAGAAHLAGLTELADLTLSGTKIGDAALQHVGELSKLKRLMLANTSVTDAGMPHLQQLPLEDLNLAVPGVGDEGLRSVSQIKTLANLSIGSPEITDIGLSHIVKLPSLHALLIKAGASRFTPEGLSELAKAKELVHLEIDDSGVSVEGLLKITTLPLEALTVYDETIDDEWLSHLRMSTLRSLRLGPCPQVTVDALVDLIRAMPECAIESYSPDTTKKIEAAREQFRKSANRSAAEWTLSVGGTVTIQTEDEEVSIAPDGMLPEVDFVLIGADFKGNRKLTDDDLARFDGLQGLRDLLLRDTQIGDAGLARLTSLPQLTQLILVGTKITDVGLSGLDRFERLDSLSLDHTEITDSGLESVGKVIGLEFLSLVVTDCTGDGLSHLRNLQGLKHLNLGNTNRPGKFNDSAVEHLRPFQKVTHFVLSGSELTNEGLARFVKVMPEVHALNVGNSQITDEGVAHLKDLKQLSGLLGLSNTELTDASIEHLKQLPAGAYTLTGTKITAQGIDELHEARPNATITWDSGVIEPE